VVLSSSGREEMGWKRSSRQASFVTSASRSRVDYDRARGVYGRDSQLPTVLSPETGSRLAVAPGTGLRGKRWKPPESSAVMHVLACIPHKLPCVCQSVPGRLDLADCSRARRADRSLPFLDSGALIYSPRCPGSIAFEATSKTGRKQKSP
jgi:hypothetical protein